MKTLDQIKDEVAQDHGFKNWGSDLHEQFTCGQVAYVYLHKLHNKVAIKYAEQAIDEAKAEVDFEIRCENTSIHRASRSIEQLKAKLQ